MSTICSLFHCSADEDIDSKFPTNIVVYSDGRCSWVPLGLFISTCAIDIRWFPFDDQLCSLKFGSWTYDGNKINLTSKFDHIETSTYKISGEWDLLGQSLQAQTPLRFDLLWIFLVQYCTTNSTTNLAYNISNVYSKISTKNEKRTPIPQHLGITRCRTACTTC